MGIRDILMVIVGYACVPIALYDAYYGLLAYCWLSFMKPQTFVWAEGVEAARMTFVVAIALIVRAAFTAGWRFQFRAPMIAFIALWAWFGVCTLLSTHIDSSANEFIFFSKMGIAVVLMTALVRTREQLKWLMVLLAVCPGIYGAKLGVFFLGGGTYAQQGGPLGMDNNDTALFIAMGVPLLVLVGGQVERNWLRYLLYAMAALSVPGVIVTASRGGFLAMVVAIGLTLWRKTTWWKAAIASVVVGFAVFVIVPEGTRGRYSTVTEYQEDPSAMGRIRAWETTAAMAASKPLTGVGFGQEAYMLEYPRYQIASNDRPHATHSVWFSLLGETGYVGLGLYVLLLGTVLVATHRVMRLARVSPKARRTWFWNVAAAVQSAALTFAVGGTFLSQARFEFAYALYLITVPLSILAEKEAQQAPGKTIAERVKGLPGPARPSTSLECRGL